MFFPASILSSSPTSPLSLCILSFLDSSKTNSTPLPAQLFLSLQFPPSLSLSTNLHLYAHVSVSSVTSTMSILYLLFVFSLLPLSLSQAPRGKFFFISLDILVLNRSINVTISLISTQIDTHITYQPIMCIYITN